MIIDFQTRTERRSRTATGSDSLPVLFISHGAPTLALESARPVDWMGGEAPARSPSGSPASASVRSHGHTAQRLAELGRRIGRPDAILMISAHWTSARPMLGGASAPETVHDFAGFAPELYGIRYPAPGSPILAVQARRLLVAAGFDAGIDTEQGLDHGAWIPLLHMYPDAGVPVVQMSVQPELGAEHHLRVGRALAPLLAEGVLMIGSGGVTHNLREAFAHRGDTSEAPWARAFADWIAERLEAGDVAALLDWRARAPEAVRNHPTDEHLMPLFVALGAAGERPFVTRVHRGGTWGALALDAWRFDHRPAQGDCVDGESASRP